MSVEQQRRPTGAPTIRVPGSRRAHQCRRRRSRAPGGRILRGPGYPWCARTGLGRCARGGVCSTLWTIVIVGFRASPRSHVVVTKTEGTGGGGSWGLAARAGNSGTRWHTGFERTHFFRCTLEGGNSSEAALLIRIRTWTWPLACGQPGPDQRVPRLLRLRASASHCEYHDTSVQWAMRSCAFECRRPTLSVSAVDFSQP